MLNKQLASRDVIAIHKSDGRYSFCRRPDSQTAKA